MCPDPQNRGWRLFRAGLVQVVRFGPTIRTTYWNRLTFDWTRQCPIIVSPNITRDIFGCYVKMTVTYLLIRIQQASCSCRNYSKISLGLFGRVAFLADIILTVRILPHPLIPSKWSSITNIKLFYHNERFIGAVPELFQVLTPVRHTSR